MSFRTAGIYNLTRTFRGMMKRYRKEPPSLIMHLYSNGFRFGNTDSTLHAYDGDMKHWVDCIREQKLPNELLDVLDESGVRFYDGCLIVEVHDHRSVEQSDQAHPPEELSSNPNLAPLPRQNGLPNQLRPHPTPSRDTPSDLPNDQLTLHRLVLSPTCETLWKDILLMNESKIAHLYGDSKDTKWADCKWGPITEDEGVQLEAAILERTTPALCLSPSIITSRIANQLLGDTTLQPSSDHKKSRKRPLNSGEEEAMRRRRERRERFMHIADESYGQPFAPTFSRFDLIKRLRTAPPAPTPSQEPEPKSNTQENVREQARSATPQITLPMDSQPPHIAPSEPNVEQNNTLKPTPNSGQLQLPTNGIKPLVSPPALPAPLPPAPAPTKKASNSKKKASVGANAIENRSETGSPAPSASGPAKKLSKKAQQQLEMTPEAAALAEEKRKKKAEQRRLQKERKLAAAAAAAAQAQSQAQAAQKPADLSVSGAGNHEPASTSVPLSSGQSIPVLGHEQAGSSTSNAYIGNNNSIPVLSSIPVPSNDSIPVPDQFNHDNNISIPVPSFNHLGGASGSMTGIPVPDHNGNSIPVPVFTNNIPVHSNNLHVPVMSSSPRNLSNSKDSIPVPSTSEMNGIPVLPNQTEDIAVGHLNQMSRTSSMENSIPVPQVDRQWNSFDGFDNLGHSRSGGDMDIHVHHPHQHQQQAQLGSIEIPSQNHHDQRQQLYHASQGQGSQSNNPAFGWTQR